MKVNRLSIALPVVLVFGSAGAAGADMTMVDGAEIHYSKKTLRQQEKRVKDTFDKIVKRLAGRDWQKQMKELIYTADGVLSRNLDIKEPGVMKMLSYMRSGLLRGELRHTKTAFARIHWKFTNNDGKKSAFKGKEVATLVKGKPDKDGFQERIVIRMFDVAGAYRIWDIEDISEQ
ncbi:MAG: hypothetical protein CEN89_417 [Candidatus Berkelbacteria bacterium Licking1014_7]|uniref:ABC transporter substrate-binding protein n=1 Tax=Candidatus Berkelbacteria bacterium Licking1014_7 TaxID=2017147 RepID=A0A554LJS5_9BACT|nr:MAG: hypothetical protein CEN89_417 [Candidatus Berkelbacteria bacterium Licking1014_7]